MSLRLRLAVLAALAMAGACPSAEPAEGPPPAEHPVPAPASPASTTAPPPAPPAAVVAVPASSEEAIAPTAAETGATANAPGAAPATASVASAFVPLVPPTPPANPGVLLSPLLPSAALDSPPPAASPEPAKPVPVPRTTRSGQEVFARLRRGLAPNACSAGSNSARWRGRYAASPFVFSRRLQGVLPLIDFVSTEVERAGLPAEFAFIPLVESWYQPGVVGPGGPAGMWQMIASTAKNHGIHIRPGYDGRLSPVESTRAALSYLKVLDGMFGDWQAIVMAYNAGEGRMLKALRRAGSRTANAAQRKPHGLSNITYDYVDKLQALSCLVLQPDRQGLRLPLEARFEPLVPLLMDERVHSLEQFAAANGKDAALLRKLNPGFREGKVVAGVPRLLLSPPIAGVDLAAGSIVQAPSRATIAMAAREGREPGIDAAVALAPLLAGAPAAEAPAMVPTTLPVPGPAPSSTPEGETQAAATAPALPAVPPEQVHEVRAGDTLSSIARDYHLPVEQILSANKLDRDARLRPGQRLRLVP